jgi:penicillin-binding protein 1A
MTLREATKHSVNSVYAQLIRDVGVKETMDLANAMGLGTYHYNAKVHSFAVGLGAGETSPIDMASAYGVWADRGLRADPTPIRRMLDRNQKVLEDNTKPATRRILKEAVADTMNDVLQGPLSPGGTAGGKGIGRPAAGKTGTTNDNTNAWFVGYTPQLSTAVWMGHLQDQKPMGPVKGVRGVTGGTWPARTWQAYMKRALDGTPVVPFNQPAPITVVVDDGKREARAGFDVGGRRRPVPTDDGGNLTQDVPPPAVEAPTTSTTSTTTPFGF